jgi:hypothetical protein
VAVAGSERTVPELRKGEGRVEHSDKSCSSFCPTIVVTQNTNV